MVARDPWLMFVACAPCSCSVAYGSVFRGSCYVPLACVVDYITWLVCCGACVVAVPWLMFRDSRCVARVPWLVRVLWLFHGSCSVALVA